MRKKIEKLGYFWYRTVIGKYYLGNKFAKLINFYIPYTKASKQVT